MPVISQSKCWYLVWVEDVPESMDSPVVGVFEDGVMLNHAAASLCLANRHAVFVQVTGDGRIAASFWGDRAGCGWKDIEDARKAINAQAERCVTMWLQDRIDLDNAREVK